MKNGFRIADVDTHLMEPDYVFEKYIDERYKSQAPKMGVASESGRRTFLVEGEPFTREKGKYPMAAPAFLNAVHKAMQRFERAAKQGFSPESRLIDMDENGYLMSTLEEIASSGGHSPADVTEALRVVHTLDPAGVGSSDLRECLLLQLESRGGKGGVAWQIVSDHLKLVELRQIKELARLLHRPIEHIHIAIDVIRHLDPRPGLRYSGPGARQVEPDVYISKDGDDYLIQVNDEDIPPLCRAKPWICDDGDA